MNRIRFVIVLLLITRGICSAAEIPAPNLVPWPQSVTMAEGGRPLTPANRIVATDPRLLPLAQVLSGEIYLSTAVRLAAVSGASAAGDIVLRFSDTIPATEGYRLTVDGSGIMAEGKTYRGVAWATASLVQAIEVAGGQARVRSMRIDDQPVAEYRGLLIDVGRQWHPVEAMRPIIEMCRLYKINYLQLHLNDNTAGMVMAFPSKAFPQLATTRKGSRTTYTIEEITGLVRYADERGVTIVPEVSGPGAHAGPVRSLSPRGNTLDIWNEKTYDCLAVLFGEVAAVFKSSPYIHLGGDEGSFGHLGKSPEEIAYRESKGIKTGPLNYYLARMDAIVKKLGKRTICWEGFGGDGGGLPKDIIVMPYESAFNPANKLVAHGFSVINTAWKPLYVVGGKKWDPEYIYDSWNLWLWEHHINTKCHIQLKETDPVIGAQICAWEQPAVVELPSTRPRIPAMSERIWNPKLGRKFTDFAPRAAATDKLLDRLLGAVEVISEGVTGPEERGFLPFTNTTKVTLVPLPLGDLHYTIDGSDPTASSPAYKSPIQLTKANAKHEKLFFNSRTKRFEQEGDVIRLKARIFDKAGQPVGDVITQRQYRVTPTAEAPPDPTGAKFDHYKKPAN